MGPPRRPCARNKVAGPVFFFSSRRRHTRSLCDWSSDVCSSNLNNTMTLLYKVASATGTADCSYVIGTAAYWAGCVVAFKDNIGIALSTSFSGVGTITGTLTAPGTTIQAQDTFLTAGRGASGIPT